MKATRPHTKKFIISLLAQAIDWATCAMWDESMGLDKENILANIERARYRIQEALDCLKEYEDNINTI